LVIIRYLFDSQNANIAIFNNFQTAKVLGLSNADATCSATELFFLHVKFILFRQSWVTKNYFDIKDTCSPSSWSALSFIFFQTNI